MKILWIIDSLSGGGAEKLTSDIVPKLSAKGHTVDVLILTEQHAKYKENLESHDIKIVTIGEKTGHFGRIKKIIEYMKKDYDIVHANLFPVTYYVSLASRLVGKKSPKIVMTEHSTDNKRRHKAYLRALERFIYKRYQKIISISDMTQTNLKEWLRLPQKYDEKFVVVYNGVPIEEFESAEPLEKKELFPNYAEGDILLGMIGSFNKQKNHKGMLEILEQLPANYKLICVGEGPLMKKINLTAHEKDLSDRLFFCGFRKDVACIMKTVDIIVIPSLWEGFGLIAVEAMACSKAIVASKVPGLSEIVGKYGLQAAPNDLNEWVECIIKLQDTNIRKGYEKCVPERAEMFGIDKMAERYEQVYKNF